MEIGTVTLEQNGPGADANARGRSGHQAPSSAKSFKCQAVKQLQAHAARERRTPALGRGSNEQVRGSSSLDDPGAGPGEPAEGGRSPDSTPGAGRWQSSGSAVWCVVRSEGGYLTAGFPHLGMTTCWAG